MAQMKDMAHYLTAATVLANQSRPIEINIKELLEKAEKLRIENEKKDEPKRR